MGSLPKLGEQGMHAGILDFASRMIEFRMSYRRDLFSLAPAASICFGGLAQAQSGDDGIDTNILRYDSGSGNYTVEVQNLNDYPVKATIYISSSIHESGAGSVCSKSTNRRTVLVKPYESEEVRFSGGCILTIGWGRRDASNSVKVVSVERLGPPPAEEEEKPRKSWWSW